MGQRLPSLKGYEHLPLQDQRAIQHLISQQIEYIDSAGKARQASNKRKIYWFFRVGGHSIAEAKRQAGYHPKTPPGSLENDSQAREIKLHFKTDQVNLAYILDRGMKIIEDGDNDTAKVKALKLLSQIKQYIKSSAGINIGEAMNVNFMLSGPAVCPHCGKRTLKGDTDKLIHSPRKQDIIDIGDGDIAEQQQKLQIPSRL